MQDRAGPACQRPQLPTSLPEETQLCLLAIGPQLVRLSTHWLVLQYRKRHGQACHGWVRAARKKIKDMQGDKSFLSISMSFAIFGTYLCYKYLLCS